MPLMSKPITDVGIDLDGVVYPFSTAFRFYCQERTGTTTLPEPTHWNFFVDWGLDEETFQTWLREAAVSHKVFATEMPYPTVIEAWELLRNHGVRIHVMTARPQESWGQTAEWLDKYGLKCDSLHFNPTKSFLTHFANGKAAMLDDHVHYYKEADKVGIVPFLMNRPWNQELLNANRVNTVLEFATAIVGYNTVLGMDKKKAEESVHLLPTNPNDLNKFISKPVKKPENLHKNDEGSTRYRSTPYFKTPQNWGKKWDE